MHGMRTARVVAFRSLFVAQIRVQVFEPFRVLWSQTKPFFRFVVKIDFKIICGSVKIKPHAS